jgi:hypothetical protein
VKHKNLQEAKKMVEGSVMTYNQRRPHTALKYKRLMKYTRRFNIKMCQPMLGRVKLTMALSVGY